MLLAGITYCSFAELVTIARFKHGIEAKKPKPIMAQQDLWTQLSDIPNLLISWSCGKVPSITFLELLLEFIRLEF